MPIVAGMNDEQRFPVIRQTVLDATDPRQLAEFYRQLLGLRYRAGDEPPAPGQPDPAGQDWLQTLLHAFDLAPDVVCGEP